MAWQVTRLEPVVHVHPDWSAAIRRELIDIAVKRWCHGDRLALRWWGYRNHIDPADMRAIRTEFARLSNSLLKS